MAVELDIEPKEVWKKGKANIVIAGPCSAESEEQVLETARQLVERTPIHFFRAGVWKPRTRPDSFEGVGEAALPWLNAVQQQYGIPVVVEVANAQHVEKALKAGLDALWIGARTTVSPFAVQEIADALQGVSIPVWVKNPINPDLNLWIGALERLNRVGIRELGAVHRGFSSTSNQFRNTPNWEIPIQLRTLLPDLPVICDPSHIAGVREKLHYVAQKALDLDFDGLMVEVHPDPDIALSDKQQQLTPAGFEGLLEALVFRTAQSKSTEFQSHLERLRSEIDEVDARLIQALAARMKLVGQIGMYKKENNVTILQLERWREILDTRLPYGQSNGLDQSFVERILQLLHDESIRVQTELFQQQESTEELDSSH